MRAADAHRYLASWIPESETARLKVVCDIPRGQANVEWLNRSAKITKACSGRAISMSLMQGLSLAAVRARR